MKRIYIALFCFWLAIGLGVSGYVKFNPPKYKNSSNKFFYEDVGDVRRSHYKSVHHKIFLQGTIVGALVVIGIGFLDRKK